MRLLWCLLVCGFAEASLLSSGDGSLALESLELVHPRRVLLRVSAQHLIPGETSEYVPEAGEKVAAPESLLVGDDGTNSFIYTGEPGTGVFNGFLANGMRRTFDRIEGSELDTTWADAMSSFTVTSSTSTAFVSGASPVAVGRKTIMAEWGYTGAYWDPALSAGAAQIMGWTARHEIVLEFSSPLVIGHQYSVAFSGSADVDATFSSLSVAFDLTALRHSEAVHVHQLGFLPAAPKHAYLSFWAGSAGGVSYDDVDGGSPSWFVQEWDAETQTGVGPQHTGTAPAVLRLAKEVGENLAEQNFQLADVYDMNVNETTTPLPLDTELVVCVDGIGCSFPFRIAKDVHSRALASLVRVFWYQRNGVELSATIDGFTYNRPATLLPEDIPLFHTNATLISTGNSDVGGHVDGQGWQTIKDGATTDPCTMVGGWMDAGDWDTRAPHLEAARQLMYLADRFPAYFDDLELGIPGESGDDLPDTLQQALFLVDSYESYQTPEGGVSGGVETLAHPRYGELSYSNSQTWYCYAPDAWTTYHFAATAALASRLLTAYGSTSRGAELEDAAELAWTWAEAHAPDPIEGPASFQTNYVNSLRDLRAVAAANMLALNGATASYKAAFDASNRCGESLVAANATDGVEAAYVFARLSGPGVDDDPAYTTLQDACVVGIDGLMPFVQDQIASTGFRVGHAAFLLQFSVTTSGMIPFMAYRVMLEDSPMDMARLFDLGVTHDFAFGCNPLNLAFITDGGVEGLFGTRALRDVLRVDSHNTGELAPPGITVTGPAGPNSTAATLFPNISAPADFIPGAELMFPDPDSEWPWFEYYVLGGWPLIAEYTPHSTLGPHALTLGVYVAAMHEAGLAAAPPSGNTTGETSTTTSGPSTTGTTATASATASSGTSTASSTTTTTSSSTTTTASSSATTAASSATTAASTSSASSSSGTVATAGSSIAGAVESSSARCGANVFVFSALLFVLAM